MAITPSNASAINVRSAFSTTNTVTLPAAPTAGNKIVYALVVDKSAGTFTAPAGFTTRASVSSTSVSLYVAEKTSEGTETGAIGATWTTSRASKAVIFELSSTGTISFDVATQNVTETAGNSLTTGSVTTGANAALALLLFGNDSAKSAPTNPDPTGSWSNGSTWLQNWTATAGYGEPAFVLGTWSGFTPGSSISSTYSHDGNTDQMATAILVFSETGAASTYTHNGSGGITSGGAATASYVSSATGTFTHTASGGITSAGDAGIKRTWAVGASGGFSVGGVVSAFSVSYVVSDGGIQSGGAADAQMVFQGVTVYSFVATGGITAAGAGITGRVRGFVASGGITTGGAATFARAFAARGVGGYYAYGVAIVSSTVLPVYTSPTVILRRRRRG